MGVVCCCSCLFAFVCGLSVFGVRRFYFLFFFVFVFFLFFSPLLFVVCWRCSFTLFVDVCSMFVVWRLMYSLCCCCSLLRCVMVCCSL